jgi:drug/metabolite transporter (DMT)-like permease
VLYLCPLIAAILYPFGSIFLKRGMAEGGGFIRGVVVSNVVMALCFVPLLAFADKPNWDFIVWPLIAGVAFFVGQVLTVIAVRVGDVSVQAPLMGTKVVFVALYSTFIRPDEVPPLLWIGASLTAVAVFLIGGTSLSALRAASRTIIFAFLSCACFGLTDTLAGYRSAEFGRIPFIVLMTALLGGFSLFLIPFAKGKFRDIPKSGLRGLTAGGVAMGLQAVVLNLGLSFNGQATAQNIVYSSRGLFGVLIVWGAGSLLGNHEALTAGPQEMRRRLCGALLLCVAIALVVRG